MNKLMKKFFTLFILCSLMFSTFPQVSSMQISTSKTDIKLEQNEKIFLDEIENVRQIDKNEISEIQQDKKLINPVENLEIINKMRCNIGHDWCTCTNFDAMQKGQECIPARGIPEELDYFWSDEIFENLHGKLAYEIEENQKCNFQGSIKNIDTIHNTPTKLYIYCPQDDDMIINKVVKYAYDNEDYTSQNFEFECANPGKMVFAVDNNDSSYLHNFNVTCMPSVQEKLYLRVDPTYKHYNYQHAANQTINVYSNVGWWIAVPDQDWIQLSVSSLTGYNNGTIRYRINHNFDEAPRTGNIRILTYDEDQNLLEANFTIEQDNYIYNPPLECNEKCDPYDFSTSCGFMRDCTNVGNGDYRCRSELCPENENCICQKTIDYAKRSINVNTILECNARCDPEGIQNTCGFMKDCINVGNEILANYRCRSELCPESVDCVCNEPVLITPISDQEVNENTYFELDVSNNFIYEEYYNLRMKVPFPDKLSQKSFVSINDNGVISGMTPEVDEDKNFVIRIEACNDNGCVSDSFNLLVKNVNTILECNARCDPEGIQNTCGFMKDCINVGNEILANYRCRSELCPESVDCLCNEPVLITPISDQEVNENTYFELDVSDNFIYEEYYLLKMKVPFPAKSFLSISDNGVISGITPEVDEDRNFVIRIEACNDHGCVSDSFNLLVKNVNQIPELVIPIENQISNENTYFELDVSDNFIYEEYYLLKMKVPFPAKSFLSISDNGVISGITPEVDEDRNFRIRIEACNDHGCVSDSFTLTVLNIEPELYEVQIVVDPNELTTQANAQGAGYYNQGDRVVITVDHISGYKFKGFEIESNKKIDYRMPRSTVFKMHYLLFDMPANDVNIIATYEYISQPPILVSEISDQEVDENEYFELDVSGNFMYETSYSIEVDEKWLSINNDGIISGVAPEVSEDTDYNITITAHNDDGQISDSFTLTVLNIEPELYEVQIVVDPNELTTQANAQGAGYYNQGDRVVITVDHISGYKFKGFEIESNKKIDYRMPRSTVFKMHYLLFDMPANDVNIIATYEYISQPPILVSEISDQEVDENEYFELDVSGNFMYETSYSIEVDEKWLSINNDGIISGVAPEVNEDTDFEVIVTAYNDDGQISDTFILTVLDEYIPQPPVLVNEISDQEVYKYEYFELDVSGNFEYETSYSLEMELKWLYISNTGIISGFAPEVNEDTDFEVIVTAYNDYGEISTSFILTVLDIPTIQTDLYINKSANVELAQVGDMIEYTLEFGNNGPYNASAIITDTYNSDKVTLVSELPENCEDDEEGTIECIIAMIDIDEVDTITYSMMAITEGEAVNTALISPVWNDLDPDNNESSVTVDIEGALVVEYGDIVINELMWSGSDLGATDEWIELRNMTNIDIDLTNFTLTKFQSGEEVHMLTIPNGIIPANGFFLISRRALENSAIDIEPDLVSTGVALSNTTLQIKLYNSIGDLLDIAGDGGLPFEGTNSTPKSSMARRYNPKDGSLKENWFSHQMQTNLKDTTNILASPGNSISSFAQAFPETVYEDGLDASDWIVYDNDPDGAIVYADNGKIITEGSGTSNGYRFKEAWNNEDQLYAKWDMQYDESVIVYLSLDTIKGHRYLEYRDGWFDCYQLPTNETYIRCGLGNYTLDNENMYTVVRDLVEDLQIAESDNEILRVRNFLIRGSGKLDNIKLLSEKNENYTISGSVTYARTGIQNAIISFGGAMPNVLTDENGHFSQWGFDNGTYDVSVNYMGINFDPELHVVVVDNSNVDNVDFAGVVDPTPTVYEDGNDASNWTIYDHTPEGAYIEVAYDEGPEGMGDNAIRLFGTAPGEDYHLDETNGGNNGNGFMFHANWANNGQWNAYWDVKSTEDMVIYLEVSTSLGQKYVEYNTFYEDGHCDDDSISGNYVKCGISQEVKSGNWYTLQKNIREDFESIWPDIQLYTIVRMRVRGNMLIDNIMLSL